MQPDLIQPGGAEIPAELVAALLRRAGKRAPSFALEHHGQFSNDVAVARLDDGRRLVVKRGRYEWSAGRFLTARHAGRLLRDAGVTAPSSLELPSALRAQALDAYWRIELPTLAELWPGLGAAARLAAMRSLGELVRRVHSAPVHGHGGLGGGGVSISQALAGDLGGRLMPAVQAVWPDGVPLVDVLLGTIPEVARRAPEHGVLLHGDLHIGNVLCERGAGTVRCVGLLDLECAHAGPRESDLARLAVLHTDLFQMGMEGPWLDRVLEGYADPVDPELIAYYSVYHLVQLGFHSAWVGHDVHAASVADAARAAVAAAPGLWRGGTAALGAHTAACA
ncbi:MAG TPA: aminoglycoside phosphotransferase family protein [Longimicrobium sp.]|nr:aminoglycoside phosphotransferase family protein [Longimicrobium sp.]